MDSQTNINSLAARPSIPWHLIICSIQVVPLTNANRRLKSKVVSYHFLTCINCAIGYNVALIESIDSYSILK